MSELEQVPFDGVDFAENPEPRCPCLLLLDTSASMSGRKIGELSTGLQAFADQLQADSMAAKRVEVAIVTFGPVQTVQDFVTADAFRSPRLVAIGRYATGAGSDEPGPPLDRDFLQDRQHRDHVEAPHVRQVLGEPSSGQAVACPDDGAGKHRVDPDAEPQPGPEPAEQLPVAAADVKDAGTVRDVGDGLGDAVRPEASLLAGRPSLGRGVAGAAVATRHWPWANEHA